MRDTILRSIIVASQRTPFRGKGGGYTNLSKERLHSATAVDKARAEADDVERFFRFFPAHDLRSLMAGKSVLDFGSGYGGRTVRYGKFASRVCGIEPVEAHIDAGKEFANQEGATNVEFKLCGDYDIPYDDNTFDMVVTFDVLEHVADPRKSLAEIYRVLKPDGTVFAVFPLYRGMFAHHLDYITLAPAIHILFDPRRVMRVVNGLLDTKYADVEVTRHPAAGTSYDGKKPVMPTLNGMGLNDFKRNAEAFEIVDLDQVSVFRHYLGGRSILSRFTGPLMRLSPTISEVLTFHVCTVMKPRKER
ncbi:hypothetical protein C7T96_10085 [Nitratireductor sp. StC3]|nr:hypothetical protein C7T96_10085 [Nitratireductor sp. StC3]